MVELMLRQDPLRPGSYHLDEAHLLGPAFQHGRLGVRSHLWQPPTDVYETEEAVVVRVEIAGMNEADFSIQLEGRSLSIRGVRPDQPERRAYHLMEIRFGEFSSEVELPHPVVVAEIEATYSQGFLRLVLPIARPRQIPVE